MMDLKVTRTPEGCLSVEVASDTIPELPQQFHIAEFIELPYGPGIFHAGVLGTSIESYEESGSRLGVVWWRRVYSIGVIDGSIQTFTEIDLLRLKPKPPTLELLKWISEPVTTTTRFTLFSRQ